MPQLMRRLRMVAMSLTKLGILPMLANSSSMQCPSRSSTPSGLVSALHTSVSKRHWQKMLAMKENVALVSGSSR